MYDELIGELYLTASTALSKSKRELLEKAADAIENLICEVADEHNAKLDSEDKLRWIPVTERLPQESDRYMVIAVEPWFGTVSAEIMKYRVNENLWVYDGRITEATVTHWMPLPEPPEEE